MNTKLRAAYDIMRLKIMWIDHRLTELLSVLIRYYWSIVDMFEVHVWIIDDCNTAAVTLIMWCSFCYCMYLPNLHAHDGRDIERLKVCHSAMFWESCMTTLVAADEL